MKCFALCFGEPSPAIFDKLRKWADTFEFETVDGGRAYSRIYKMVPDLIIVDGDKKPSHVVQTLRAVLQLKKIESSRILIVTTSRPQHVVEFASENQVELVSPDELDAALER